MTSGTTALLFLCCRQRPGGAEGPVLHRPVRAGAHQTARDQTAALQRALLPRLQPHPQGGPGGRSAGTPVRHPGAVSEGDLRHGER